MADLFDPPFVVSRPAKQTVPFVFNSPHSGSHYPDVFLKASRLDPLTLRKSEDAHVDILFDRVTGLGAPLMRALFPRAYLDLNREPYELDPAMFSGPLPEYVNSRSARVAGGLGTVARVVGEGHEIYRQPLDFDDAKQRIETLYKPYHQHLAALVGQTARKFGAVLLIDCHSMPSCVETAGGVRGLRPDIILGDRFGSTCDERITGYLEKCLVAMGYAVVRNRPYSGGYITQTYAAAGDQCHALQIEINRDLYMDEDTLEKTSDFDQLASDLVTALADLADSIKISHRGYSLAAE